MGCKVKTYNELIAESRTIIADRKRNLEWCCVTIFEQSKIHHGQCFEQALEYHGSKKEREFMGGEAKQWIAYLQGWNESTAPRIMGMEKLNYKVKKAETVGELVQTWMEEAKELETARKGAEAMNGTLDQLAVST